MRYNSKVNPRESKRIARQKYGVTLKDDEQTLDTWLNHIQEELMDAVNYIEKARAVLGDEIEDAMLKRIEIHDEETI